MNIFSLLMIMAMLAVVGALFVGLFGMVQGGDFNRRYGNRLMRLRVLMQGLALAFFVLALLASGD